MPRTGFEPMLPDFKLCKTLYTMAFLSTLIPVIVWKIYNLTHVTEAWLWSTAGAGNEKGVVYERIRQTITGLCYWEVSLSQTTLSTTNWREELGGTMVPVTRG
jgi:hypothetical protein